MVPLMVPPKERAGVFSFEVEEIEDEDGMHKTAVRNSGVTPSSSFQMSDISKVRCIYRT